MNRDLIVRNSDGSKSIGPCSSHRHMVLPKGGPNSPEGRAISIKYTLIAVMSSIATRLIQGFGLFQQRLLRKFKHEASGKLHL